MPEYEIIQKGRPPQQDALGPRCPECKAKWALQCWGYDRGKGRTWRCRLCRCVFKKKEKGDA